MDKFLEGFSGELAKNWWVRAYSPAFVFWICGALSVTGSLKTPYLLNHLIDDFFNNSSDNDLTFISLSFFAFLLLIVSTWIVERTTAVLLRLLEGYWPLHFGFWLWRVRAAQAKFDTLRAEWQALSILINPDAAQRRRRAELDNMLRHFPRRELILPTRLGNALCAAETRPVDKYGLDAVVCWPRLWLLLPKENRDDIAAARAVVNDGARLWAWSGLTAIWSIWTWWLCPIAILCMYISYKYTLSAGNEFADLVESIFDTKRVLLYEALGWPKPSTPASEPTTGKSLTRYLLRGSDSDEPKFEFSKKGNAERNGQCALKLDLNSRRSGVRRF